MAERTSSRFPPIVLLVAAVGLLSIVTACGPTETALTRIESTHAHAFPGAHPNFAWRRGGHANADCGRRTHADAHSFAYRGRRTHPSPSL